MAGQSFRSLCLGMKGTASSLVPSFSPDAVTAQCLYLPEPGAMWVRSYCLYVALASHFFDWPTLVAGITLSKPRALALDGDSNLWPCRVLFWLPLQCHILIHTLQFFPCAKSKSTVPPINMCPSSAPSCGGGFSDSF